jgi:hypothetical protein
MRLPRTVSRNPRATVSTSGSSGMKGGDKNITSPQALNEN